MAGNKTRDGIRIPRIVGLAERTEYIIVRTGSNHTYVLNCQGMRPCPVAVSTDARRMLVPWFRQITGRETNEIYQALRRGSW